MIGERPSAGRGSSTMTIEISGIQETCQHRIRNFPGATHGLNRRSVNWLPKKSAPRATHCAQYECLTITRCRFAPGNGTTRIRGFSGALFRKCSSPHNKTPRCTFARLLLPPNGAMPHSPRPPPRAASHCKDTQSGALVLSGTRIADVGTRVRLNDETTRFPKFHPFVPRSPCLRGVAHRCSRLLDEVC
jgi:hypothetical protein